MMHHRLAQRAVVASLQSREDADAVLGRIVGQLRTENISARGEKVGQANELLAGRARLDTVGPADDEGYAMSAVENVCFVPAEVGTRVVSFGGQFIELRFRRTSVVAGENDECAPGEAVPVERCQHLSH